MKKFLQIEELDALAIGATLLGSGGGGDPKPELLRTKEVFTRFGLPELISVEELDDDDLIVPIGFMGAPLVSIEKLPSGNECLAVLKEIERYFAKKPKALVAAEIGGSNAFVPIALAAQIGLPVVDADTLGRAFPELNMSSCALSGISCSPAILADAAGNTVLVNAKTPKQVEGFCRALCEQMGSSVAVALYLLTGKQAKTALVPNSISTAIQLGNEIMQGKLRATKLATGVISDIQQDIQGGFLHGKVQIIGDGMTYEVDFQNEYLVAKSDTQVLATTPDIIAIVEKESGLPLPVERLKYGLAVDLIALAAPNIWLSDQALSIVGPRAFGYNFDYKGIIR